MTNNETVMIRMYLARSGLHQVDLAKALGIAQQSVSRRMAGTKAWTVTELRIVATTLGVELEDLLVSDTKQLSA